MKIPTPAELKGMEEMTPEVKDAFVTEQVERLQNEIITVMSNGARSDRIHVTTVQDESEFKKRYKLAGWIACEPAIELALRDRFHEAGWWLRVTWQNMEDGRDQMIVFRYTLDEVTTK